MEDDGYGPPASLDDEDEQPTFDQQSAALVTHESRGDDAENQAAPVVAVAAGVAADERFGATEDAGHNVTAEAETAPSATMMGFEPPAIALESADAASHPISQPAAASEPSVAALPAAAAAPPSVILDPFSDPVLLREKALKYQKAAIKLRDLYRETKAELATKSARLAALASVADTVKGSVLSRPALRDGSPPFRIVAKVPAGTIMSSWSHGSSSAAGAYDADEVRVLRRSWLCLQPVRHHVDPSDASDASDAGTGAGASSEEWAPEEAVLAALQLLVTLQSQQRNIHEPAAGDGEGGGDDSEPRDRDGNPVGNGSAPSAPQHSDRRQHLFSPEGLIARAPLLAGPGDVARLAARAEGAGEDFRRFRVRAEALQRQKDGEIASLREAAIKAAVAAAAGTGIGTGSLDAGSSGGSFAGLPGLRGSGLGLAASMAGRPAAAAASSAASSDSALAGVAAGHVAALERALEETRAANRALQARLERSQRQLAVAAERERGWEAERSALRQGQAVAADGAGGNTDGSAGDAASLSPALPSPAVAASPAAPASEAVARAESALADAVAVASAACADAEAARAEAARDAAACAGLRDSLEAAREELAAYRRRAQGMLREKDDELAAAKRQLREKEVERARDRERERGVAAAGEAASASESAAEAAEAAGSLESAREGKTPSAAAAAIAPHTPAPRERSAFPLSATAASAAGSHDGAGAGAGLDAARAAYLRNVMLRYLSTPPTEGLGAPSSIRAALEPAIMTVLGLASAEVAAAASKQHSGTSGHTHSVAGTPASAIAAASTLAGSAVTPAASVSASAARVGTGSASITGGKPLPPAPPESDSTGFLGSLLSSFFSPAPAGSSTVPSAALSGPHTST